MNFEPEEPSCNRHARWYVDRVIGTGLAKGFVETARNFVGTYIDSEARLTTVEYPEERLPLKEATRQFPFLVYDGADAQAGMTQQQEDIGAQIIAVLELLLEQLVLLRGQGAG